MKQGKGESDMSTISGHNISSSSVISLSSFPMMKELYNLKYGNVYNIQRPFSEHVIAIFNVSCNAIDTIGEL